LESVSVGAESAIERLPQTSNIPPALLEATVSATKKLTTGESMSQREQFALEAIIIPDKRPAVDIIDGDYTVAHPDWTSFNAEPIKANLRQVIPSIGRVELPHHPTLPYGGTGFVVGQNLLMTNRHVAEIFCGGLGLRDLILLRGREAGVDFLQEKGTTTSTILSVREVVMIHPYWDMALLRVDGLGSDHSPLVLSLVHPEDMFGDEVAVIGYPAFDPRNDANVQNTVFGGVYYVKRLQPGKIGKLRPVESFGKDVSAVTHDSSTLGGNSGSAVVHAATGQVIGLHFAGVYLDANFAVPTSELARDAHVLDVGLNFQGKVRPVPNIWNEWWRTAEGAERTAKPARITMSQTPVPQTAQRPVAPPQAPAVAAPAHDTISTGGTVTFTIPLEVSVRLGGVAAPSAPTQSAEAAFTEAMVEPIHDDDYGTREGYDPEFLGVSVPVPEVTDLAIVAKLDNGDHVIPYHHFSLAMHKARRLAIFTASNLDSSAEMHAPEPGKKFTRKALGGLGQSDTEKWFSDPRIPAIHQLPDRFFTKDHGAFDKGHLVRREDVAWGQSFDEAQSANGDTFHTTNCSPQIGKFNRPDQQSNWGELEKFVSKQADHGRLCIFAGPVLSDADQTFVGVDDEGSVRVQTPSRYWKVVVAVQNGKLESFGFLLQQNLSAVPLEFAVSPKWQQHMISIANLEDLLGLVRFPSAVRSTDQAGTKNGEAVRASAGVEMVAGSAQPASAATADDANARARSALPEGPLTFRDHFVSLYQSAVADIAGKIAAEKKSGIESLSQDGASELILAAQSVALMQTSVKVSSQAGAGAPGKESVLEKMSVADHAATCASLGWQLMQAKVFGDTVTARRLEGELDAGTCDPRWAQTITEYVKYFGVNGTRERPIYVTPAEAGDKVVTIKSGAKVALIGDWGTGAEPAKRVLQQVRQQNPDILIHLGDIYYSGTEEECKVNFEAIVNGVFDRAKTKLPVYTMSGNHDMYCGGVGYYPLIKRLNKGFKGPKGESMVQPASFFCLRAEDASWQLLAMDTGRNDYSPFSVTDAVTFVDPAEQEWLRARVQEFSGKTILLSHHQLFSAYSQIGSRGQNGRFNPVNPKLRETYKTLTGSGKAIPAWFWGHEHNLCIYQPYAGLERGRCLGHSAIPVFVDDTPYDVLAEIDNPPKLVDKTKLSKAGQFYSHGFAVLTLGSDGNATAEYFEDINGAGRKTYTETIS
jgi:DNA/RNA endonuclease G (NUC1)